MAESKSKTTEKETVNKKSGGGEKKEKKPRKRNTRDGKNFTTFEGHILTPNETKFIDLYIQYGNGAKAYTEAYRGPGEKCTSARQLAARVLSKEYIANEINHRLEMAKTEAIADASEVMKYFTDVMRGEIKDQFGLEASLGERTKAAQELAKRLIDTQQKANNAEAPEIKITVDWTRPTQDGGANNSDVANINGANNLQANIDVANNFDDTES